MEYNKHSLYEKPIEECPTECGNCEFFREGIRTGWCTANGCDDPTYSFSKPLNNPLPYPLNCYWWYANSVLKKLNPSKIEELKEKRRQCLAYNALLNSQMLTQQRRSELIEHYHRCGGGGIIEVEQFPEFLGFYEMVKINDEPIR